MNNELNMQLPIYKQEVGFTRNKQQRFRGVCETTFPIPSLQYPQFKIPSFVFKRPSSVHEITEMTLYSLQPPASSPITIGDQYNWTTPDNEIITAWIGNETSLICGFYYYEIICGDEAFYSDVFQITDGVQSQTLMPIDHVKITLKPSCNYGQIPFDYFEDFQIETYLETEPIRPEYIETKEVEVNEAGISQVISRKVLTSYLLVVTNCYQPLVDYLNELSSYTIDKGSIKMLIPLDEIEKDVVDITVEDVDYSINECTPIVRMRVIVDERQESYCVDYDLCKFRSPRPDLTSSGLTINVTASIDEGTFAQIVYFLDGETPSPFDGFYSPEDMFSGVDVLVDTAGMYTFTLRIYKFGCDLVESASRSITV